MVEIYHLKKNLYYKNLIQGQDAIPAGVGRSTLYWSVLHVYVS